jgi:hypothetical protein
MAEYYAQKVKSVARYDIPAPLAREIGRFLVTWAHFEHYIQALVWSALEIGEEEGRISVRDPRMSDRLDLLRDLCEFQNKAVDYVLIREIKKKAEPLAARRHLLAHTIWTKIDNDWCPLQTRGSWKEMGFEIANYPTGSKAVQPHAAAVSFEDVREWTQETIELIEDLKKVGDRHQPVPLPGKRIPRSVPRNRKLSHNDSKPRSPRQSPQD